MKYEALWGYEAVREDELTLEEGDIVFVENKDTDDIEWWEGYIIKKNGRLVYKN